MSHMVPGLGETPKPEARTCFVIGAIGGDGTPTRRRFEGIVDTVVRPALEPIRFEVEDPHRTFNTGSISRRIIERLLEVDLVVADLTELNANVMYELAVRHAKRRPVLQIMEAPLALPFDLKDELTYEYTNDFAGTEELRRWLRGAASQAMDLDQEVDNPIYRAARLQLIEDQVAATGDDFQRLMLERMESLERAVMESRKPVQKPGEYRLRLNSELIRHAEEFFHPRPVGPPREANLYPRFLIHIDNDEAGAVDDVLEKYGISRVLPLIEEGGPQWYAAPFDIAEVSRDEQRKIHHELLEVPGVIAIMIERDPPQSPATGAA